MRIKLFSLAIALFAFALLSATPLRADSLTEYTYQAGGNTFTWVLPTHSVPDAVYPGSAFTIENLSFTENGVSMVGTLDFYNWTSSGGFDLYLGNFDYLCNAIGPQLYYGTESSPTLRSGIFFLLDYGNSDTPQNLGILQAKAVSELVPEPSSFALLAVGLLAGLTVLLLRKN